LKPLAEEEPLLPYGMTVKRAEHFKALILVEATSLKLLGIEPKSNTAISTRNTFILAHE